MPVTTIKDAMVPRGRVDRPGTAIAPTSVTIHNTANSGRGANARAHARALVSGSLLREYLRSWHFTVDDRDIYRHIPIAEMAYHARGGANASSIGMEICQHPEQDDKLAYENAAWLAASLLRQIGRDCPGVIRGRRGGWRAFVDAVEAASRSREADAAPAADARPAKVNFTGRTPEAAARKLEDALADATIRSIVRSEFLHAAGESRHRVDDVDLVMAAASAVSSWQPHHMKAHYATAKAKGWIQAFKDEAAKRGFEPAGLMAIASRETNMRNIIGDSGHGYGLMQIDDRSFPDWVKSGAWKDAKLGIAKGALVLSDKQEQIEQGEGKKLTVGGKSFTGAKFTKSELQRITLAAYNSGLNAYYHFSKSGNPDAGTTGKDYSADVLKRAVHFAELLK